MRARGFWGPRGSDEEVWEQQQLQAPQNRARELDSQAEGQRGGGPPGGWHEQRQTEVGAEHPSAGTHRPPPQHPSPSEVPGSRLPRRCPAVLLSTQKSCVRCPVAGPCPGEEEDSERDRMPGQRGTSGGCWEAAQGGPGGGRQGLSRVGSSVLNTESTGAPGVPGPGTQQRGRDGAQRARRPSPDQTCGSRGSCALRLLSGPLSRTTSETWDTRSQAEPLTPSGRPSGLITPTHREGNRGPDDEHPGKRVRASPWGPPSRPGASPLRGGKPRPHRGSMRAALCQTLDTTWVTPVSMIPALGGRGEAQGWTPWPPPTPPLGGAGSWWPRAWRSPDPRVAEGSPHPQPFSALTWGRLPSCVSSVPSPHLCKGWERG